MTPTPIHVSELMRFLAIIAALCLASPAGAQNVNAVTNRTGLVTNFDLPTVTRILRELRMEHQVAPGSGGRFINVQLPNGVRATLGRTACRGDGLTCKGLTMTARFGAGPAGWSELEKLRRANSFNARNSFIKAGVDGDGQFYLVRYELADFGVSRGAVATSLLVFANLAQQYREHLAG